MLLLTENIDELGAESYRLIENCVCVCVHGEHIVYVCVMYDWKKQGNKSWGNRERDDEDRRQGERINSKTGK